MVTHAQKFGLFADVEMVPQVLLIGSFIKPIDEVLQQLAGTIGCNFMANLYASLAKKLSTMIWGVEHKGEIIQAEGFLVVITIHQVVFLTLLHGQDHDVI